MSASNLKDILTLVGPIIAKSDANMRKAISAKERMADTLRFLATLPTNKVHSIYFH